MNELSFILPLIRSARGQRVILDADLARLYGVSTRQLNQQFRRNRRRFPPDFSFQLSRDEAARMMSQIVTSSNRRNRRSRSIVFTEHGAVMAANVIKSKRAIAVSVIVVRAFVQLRRFASSHEKIARLISDLESAVKSRLDRQDQGIAALFQMIEAMIAPPFSGPRRKIGSA